MKILNMILNSFRYREYYILLSKIQIVNAKIKCEDEVLQMKPGRQKNFEITSIEKAKRNLPYLRGRLADFRKEGFE